MLLRLPDFARCNCFTFPYKAKDVRDLSKIHRSNTATREAGTSNLQDECLGKYHNTLFLVHLRTWRLLLLVAYKI